MVKSAKQFGDPLAGWTPPPRPGTAVLRGSYVALEPLSAERHAAELHEANSVDDAIWDYLPYGPFDGLEGYSAWVESAARSDDPQFYAARILATGHVAGVLSYLRISPDAGSIEVGHINFSPALQRTRAATEAIFLLMQWAFDAGYRRFEWKCDALNIGSRRAAQRFGFSYEGVFRQATLYKGRNRDTAWFACIDKEWPALKQAYETWLAPENFDEIGQQKRPLGALTGPVRFTSDPLL